jgi:hypothetical protein
MHWLDPDYLPKLSGTFECFLLNPHGDADGMILSDGTEVHFPPHLSNDMRAAIPPGAKPNVTIRGVRARGSELIAAVAIDLPDGTRILDNGPEQDHESKKKEGKHPHPRKHQPMHAEGVVRSVLHGPKGEARGVLLEDGKSIRFPPHEAKRFARLLFAGKKVAVRGDGLESALGTVIEARELGASPDDLHALKHKKPKRPKDEKHPHHA